MNNSGPRPKFCGASAAGPTPNRSDFRTRTDPRDRQTQKRIALRAAAALAGIGGPQSESRFLGVGAEAYMEIKAAYRRLSKEYHRLPDTTSLPLKTASEKFIKLREAYNVLSREESRKFYDWALAQEAESKRAALKLEDPYQQDVQNAESIPDMVDRLSGKNMQLSDQAMTALTFDIAIIIFCICCIVYVVFFKEPY
ncbi:LOW QUALITY PROTEIN: NAD(P)H-quinone oxidoreductase subunit T, chloroplastic [Dendrobium catenatum]|uniref:LOW QUALITY PROTEIN: NAD(P)H-quinone oxidoreductase subunit T, chloroplastic n=1 Tax=Dendrobium catenatum TaxID=906689 RepID=UPI00109FF975|nr:LOW QUALITY PROTEIN: NAD(P)H-quinone oxidoreductase subunit T, chloroplastic [Dendrobium catenatum]